MNTRREKILHIFCFDNILTKQHTPYCFGGIKERKKDKFRFLQEIKECYDEAILLNSNASLKDCVEWIMEDQPTLFQQAMLGNVSTRTGNLIQKIVQAPLSLTHAT